ncbi:MAG: hypothetical protein ACFCUW_08555 [Kiloniellaceae bacterium]
MLGTHPFRWLFLAACVFPVGCGVGTAADESAEQLELLGGITERIIDTVLCEDGSYLTCLKITAEQCRAELKTVGEVCQARMLGDVPEISEQNLEAFREFGQELGWCLMDTHLETGDFDRETAGACVNPQ